MSQKDTDHFQNGKNIIKFSCLDCVENRTFLFTSALHYAKTGKVVYIMRDEIEELPQHLLELDAVNRHYMKTISFMYAKTLESLVESIYMLPQWQNVPTTVIIDTFNKYCPKDELQQACAVVALLIDTLDACSKAINRSCYNLLVSIDREAVEHDYCTLLQELYSTM